MAGMDAHITLHALHGLDGRLIAVLFRIQHAEQLLGQQRLGDRQRERVLAHGSARLRNRCDNGAEHLRLQQEPQLEGVHLADRAFRPLGDRTGRDVQGPGEGCPVAVVGSQRLLFGDGDLAHGAQIKRTESKVQAPLIHPASSSLT